MNLPLPGPTYVDCPCGCGEYGVPRKKAWRDGLNHVKRCPCRRCVGGRQRGNARRRENTVAKATGGTRDAMSGALSGVDGRAGFVVWEETANESLVRGLRRWWTSVQIRRKMARIMQMDGVVRCFVASWDGRPQVVVVPFEDWSGFVAGEPVLMRGPGDD